MPGFMNNSCGIVFDDLRRSAFNLSLLLCFLMLSIEPQAAGLDQGGRKAAVKGTQTKTDKTQQAPASNKLPATSDKSKASDKKVVYQGIAIELNVKPVHPQKKETVGLREADDVTFQFTINDTATAAPVTGAHPAAWVSLERPGENADCVTKIKAFIGGGLLARPELDLNIYYVLALNQDATVSVIDPHFGYGGSKLLAMVSLKSTGEDWALTSGARTLFVSMPDSNQVAIVDAVTWKVITNIDAGPRPGRLAVQPGGQNVWVEYGASQGDGGDSGVAVIASEGLKVVARIPTGKGHHEIAFSDDDRLAFVTNRDDGTVSIIDVRSLKKIKDIQTGHTPSSIAFSAKGKMAYVVNEEDGTIVAVDGARLKIVARIQAEPGLGQIRFAPGGRFAFIPNPTKNAVHIFDAASNRIVQTADIENGPDRISFSDRLAYVRCQRSEIVLMIPLPQADTQGQSVAVLDFPGGQHPFGKTSKPSPADSIVQAPGENAVLVGNAADKSIYYYKEGMAAPMGSFINYGREPRAVLVVDRSLKQRSPGVYETTAKLTRAGLYSVAFLMDSPRITHCFPVQVEANPDLAAARESEPVHVEPLIRNRMVRVGERTRLQFRLSDPKTKEPKVGGIDVSAVIFAPGVWQNRQAAKEVDAGLYEIEFEPPQSGVYYVYLESPSLGLKLDNPHYVILQASEQSQKEP